MKVWLMAGASSIALFACSSATGDHVGDASTSGGAGTLATGGAAGSSGGAGAGSSGGATAGGSGGMRRGGAGGSGAVSGGGAGGVSGGTGIGVNCCASGCDERCTPKTSRTCAGGAFSGALEQDCRCDGSGWDAVRSRTAAGGACPVLDAGNERPDAADSGSTSVDASPSDAGTYCTLVTPGTGGAPSTYCQSFPRGCSSCACIPLPYSYCTCAKGPGGVSVQCLGA
jgi:hypothetical protein